MPTLYDDTSLKRTKAFQLFRFLCAPAIAWMYVAHWITGQFFTVCMTPKKN